MDEPIVPFGTFGATVTKSNPTPMFQFNLGKIEVPSYVNEYKNISFRNISGVDEHGFTPRHYVLLGGPNSVYIAYTVSNPNFQDVGGFHNFPASHYVASQNKDKDLLRGMINSNPYKLDEFNRSYVFYLIYNPNEDVIDKFLQFAHNLRLIKDPFGQLDRFGLTFIHFWFLVGKKERVKRYLTTIKYITDMFHSLTNDITITQVPTYPISKFLPEEP
ncbi:hypothetical protein TVAG_146490 [Trichomonas vaginalis G3]|uniref:Uncharacterized protein n=1 Tax=Trichomonas vaginalis (strain ATCC PRA-98 / G3) TaxID=412133 RepID=A2DKV3_TRIV3|nr:hypothetical protein TVAGG3_0361360 [Trichomonas vaginalis G3]EAY18906.1 hypothetical protein TVAG_146490 [Trichomonas vaginalis G3]KAI5531961.1 hypothetical protein TVAGG3_0361360 [Trichomonas vaginalis G3]|eukprot:XP_001579892.1 hypothetical protein [Trichomonas vaginalis G3]